MRLLLSFSRRWALQKGLDFSLKIVHLSCPQIHMQLTGMEINSAAQSPDERIEALRAAMRGLSILLVLDGKHYYWHQRARALSLPVAVPCFLSFLH